MDLVKFRGSYNGVVNSILLYGAPVWVPVLKLKKYKNMPESTQRKMRIRVASAYCMVSSCAIQVVTAVLLITLHIEIRVESFNVEAPLTETIKRELSKRTLSK